MRNAQLALRAHTDKRVHPVKSTYETGMKVTYDPTSKRVVVAFRGRIIVLPGTYDSASTGISAGESRCRELGWNPNFSGKKKSFRSLF